MSPPKKLINVNWYIFTYNLYPRVCGIGYSH